MTFGCERGADKGNRASMRPRLIAVDDALVPDQLLESHIASMRPRLIAVDDAHEQVERSLLQLASMRPRLIAVDDRCGSGVACCSRPCFNEATADRRG